MKKQLIALLVGLGILATPLIAFAVILGATGGGTGYGSASSTSNGYCLTVASTSPFLTYSFSPCSTVSSPWLLNGTSTYYNSGNVGIGTSTPSNILQVYGPGTTQLTLTRSTGVSLNNDFGSGNSAWSMIPQAGTAWSMGVLSGTSSSFAIVNGSSLSSITPALTILHGGNVGIGTTTPVDKLDVTNASGTIALSVLSTSTPNNLFEVDSSSSTAYLQISSSGVQTESGNNFIFSFGGFAKNRTTVTTSSTIPYTDNVVSVVSPSALTITLPATSTLSAGQEYLIDDENGTAATYNIMIKGNTGETIDGTSTIGIYNNYGSLTLIWDGASNFEIQ